MIKNKKLIIVIALIINGLKLLAMQPNGGLEVKNFEHDADASHVEQILRENCNELFANPQFNIGGMLSDKTITPQVKGSHNFLIMKVLKCNNTIVSFVAYEKAYPAAFIRLLVTGGQARRKGYGSILLSHVFNSLANQKFTTIAIETREQYSAAVAFYEKLLRSKKDISYSKMPVTVPNKYVTDVIRYEITLTKKE